MMIGATTSAGSFQGYSQLPTRNVTESEFLQRSNVFEEIGRFAPSQLFIDGNYLDTFLIKNEGQYRVKYNGNLGARGPHFNAKPVFQAGELAKVLIGNPVKGIRFLKGVFSEGGCPNPDNFLKNHPVGSYFIYERSGEWRILIKTGENEVKVGVIPAYDKDFNNSAEDIYREIDRCVEKGLSEFFNRPNNKFQPLVGQMRICQTSLDLSFFSELSTPCFKRILVGLTPDSLKGVEQIIFQMNDRVINLCDGNSEKKIVFRNNFIELLIHLGKMGRMDYHLAYHRCQIDVQESSDRFCHEVIKRMQLELQGPQLDSAIDLFLSGVFCGTPVPATKLVFPVLDPTWEQFYNKEDKEPTTQFVLPHSKEVIFAHKTHLARISKKLNRCLFDKNWNESKIGEFPLPNTKSGDKALTQFVKLAYGIKPDFTDTDPFELIEIAKVLESSIFLDYANEHFDDLNTKIDPLCLYRLIEKDLWQVLPAKKLFFCFVGVQWGEIMNEVPEANRKQFREKFIAAWGEFVQQQNPKGIKV